MSTAEKDTLRILKGLNMVTKTRVEHVKEWRARNPEKHKAQLARYRAKSKNVKRNNHFVSNYGVTLEERDAMIATQEGACLCCGATGIRLVLDHCHSTDVIRGMVCSPCNTGLGVYEKSAETFKSYLEKYG